MAALEANVARHVAAPTLAAAHVVGGARLRRPQPPRADDTRQVSSRPSARKTVLKLGTDSRPPITPQKLIIRRAQGR